LLYNQNKLITKNLDMLSQDFIGEMKASLLKKKAELETELKGLKPHEELGTDMDASAQEVGNDEVNQDVIATIHSDLEKIENALKKIETGTYGTDSEGKQISEERLRVLPWADKAI
jgi:RNA polymerase-binding transcription factor DksA